jgi:undecaprenyl-diphosphatase
MRDLIDRLEPWLARVPALKALLGRASRAERTTLVAVTAAAGLVALFAKIAEEVVEGDTRGFDERLMLALRASGNPADPIGPVWLEEMMRDFTALGSTGVLAVMTLAVIGFLVFTQKRHAAALVAVSVAGGTLISSLMKFGFARPRPDLVPHETIVSTASFPSGHSMMSAVVYLTLGVLLARTQAAPRVKIYVLAVAFALTLLVGVSRVYLGVHWPTDVLAGWALGAAWALYCWLAALWLQTRGRIEEPNGEPHQGRS